MIWCGFLQGFIGEFATNGYPEKWSFQVGGKWNANDFAKAILTTDTATKTIAVTETFGRDVVTMAGVAKGSGMIHPNMATMLGFITCDANISSDTLQLALSQNVEKTFNQITVDGDTSTNDMVLVMSNGCALNDEILPDTPEFDKFSKMLNFVMQELAKKIAKDGEGANKLIQVDVVNAPNALDARMMAKSVVGSSLVKTAIFGEDPNWGRILAAVGYAGVDVPVDNVDIMLGGLPVMLASSPVTFDDEEMKDIMHGDEVTINSRPSFGPRKKGRHGVVTSLTITLKLTLSTTPRLFMTKELTNDYRIYCN